MPSPAIASWSGRSNCPKASELRLPRQGTGRGAPGSSVRGQLLVADAERDALVAGVAGDLVTLHDEAEIAAIGMGAAFEDGGVVLLGRGVGVGDAVTREGALGLVAGEGGTGESDRNGGGSDDETGHDLSPA